MRTVVIAGASGLVGAACTRALLAHPEVERVVAVVRRPLGIKDPKLDERIVSSFADKDALDAAIPKDVEDAYCALGTTIKTAGSQEAFLAVDKDAVVAFARACKHKGARRFMLVSSLGADARSMNFYTRTKGEVEDAVKAIGFDALHLMRPSILDGDRKESRPGEAIGLVFMRALAPVLGKYAPSRVDDVARAMVKVAFSDRFGVFVHAGTAEIRAL